MEIVLASQPNKKEDNPKFALVTYCSCDMNGCELFEYLNRMKGNANSLLLSNIHEIYF